MNIMNKLQEGIQKFTGIIPMIGFHSKGWHISIEWLERNGRTALLSMTGLRHKTLPQNMWGEGSKWIAFHIGPVWVVFVTYIVGNEQVTKNEKL